MKKPFRPRNSDGVSVQHWIGNTCNANLLSGGSVSGSVAFVDPLGGTLVPGAYVGDWGSLTIDAAGAWTYTLITDTTYSGTFERIRVPSTSNYHFQGRNGLFFDITIDPAATVGDAPPPVVTPPVDPTPSAPANLQSLAFQIAMQRVITPATLALPFNVNMAFAA